MNWWQQFRYIGIPRCRETFGHGEGFERCDRLIWPWQAWVCEVEAWPVHHDCHHRHVAAMYAWNLMDERENPLKSNPDYHWDGYDRCDFCKRTTPSGFTEVPA